MVVFSRIGDFFERRLFNRKMMNSFRSKISSNFFQRLKKSEQRYLTDQIEKNNKYI